MPWGNGGVTGAEKNRGPTVVHVTLLETHSCLSFDATPSSLGPDHHRPTLQVMKLQLREVPPPTRGRTTTECKREI